MHIHVDSPVGEAKFWIHPEVELAQSHNLPKRELNRIRKLVEEYRDVISSAWDEYFGS